MTTEHQPVPMMTAAQHNAQYYINPIVEQEPPVTITLTTEKRKVWFDGSQWKTTCSTCNCVLPMSNATALRMIETIQCEVCKVQCPADEWPGWGSNHKSTTRFSRGGKRH